MLSVIYSEFHMWALYAECHYAERRYAECHGAFATINDKVMNKLSWPYSETHGIREREKEVDRGLEEGWSRFEEEREKKLQREGDRQTEIER